jgi:hypothetical protein
LSSATPPGGMADNARFRRAAGRSSPARPRKRHNAVAVLPCFTTKCSRHESNVPDPRWLNRTTVYSVSESRLHHWTNRGHRDAKSRQSWHGRIRTDNPRNQSPPLCQLSYVPSQALPLGFELRPPALTVRRNAVLLEQNSGAEGSRTLFAP